MKHLIFMILLAQLLFSKQIVLPKQEQKSWTFKSEIPQISDYMPLGNYVIEVVTPPNLLHSVSLPFTAQLNKLYKANYQKVKKGENLAELTATSWLKVQKKAISDAIEFMHHEHMTERKAKLCKEEIIAKKECLIADAELQSDKIKLESSKMLVKSFGASDMMVDSLFKKFIIEPKLPLVSPVTGTLIEVNIQPGDNLQSDQVLFTIVKAGKLWLESDIPQAKIGTLASGQKIKIAFANRTIYAKVSELSPMVNKQNQTRHVRFELLKEDRSLLSGLRQSVSILVPIKSVKVSKSSLVIHEGQSIVFIKNNLGYESIHVSVIAETDDVYYLKFHKALTGKVLTSGAIVLKTLMDGDDD